MRRSTLAMSSEERRGLSRAEAGCEVREDPAAGPRFVGHAAVFDTRTAIGNPLTWGFYEQVAAGSFTKTLSEGDSRFLIDHDPFYVVSRVTADTLDLAQDRVGLAVDSALDLELSYVRDLQANVRNRNITGMSFGFYVVKDDWTSEKVETSDGQEAEVEVRTIQEVRLIEVSAVTFPAYDATDAGLRSQVVAALRCRGDRDAVSRRAALRPEFAGLLDELPATTTVIDLAPDGARKVLADSGMEHDDTDEPDAPDIEGEPGAIGRDEPGESTRPAADESDDDTDAGEPGETTLRNAPSIAQLNRARALRFGLPLS